MHIFLLILKIIGIILAAVLLLLLLAAGVILFSPFKYTVDAKKEGKDIEAYGKARWILGAVRLGFTFELKDGERRTDSYLKIFGIKKKKKAPQEETENNDHNESGRQTEHKDTAPQELITEKEETDEIKTSKTTYEETENETKETVNEIKIDTDEEIKENGKKKKREKKEDSGSLKERIALIKDILFDPEKKELREKVLKNSGKLLKHICPKKIRGFVAFGTDDPALTGEILGFLSAVYAATFPVFRLEPDFENKKLEGDIKAKGRIFLVTFLILCYKIYIKSGLRDVLKKGSYEEKD